MQAPCLHQGQARLFFSVSVCTQEVQGSQRVRQHTQEFLTFAARYQSRTVLGRGGSALLTNSLLLLKSTDEPFTEGSKQG